MTRRIITEANRKLKELI